MLSEPVATAIYPTLRMRALELVRGDEDRAASLVQEAMVTLCAHRAEWSVPTAGRYARLTLRSLVAKGFED